MRYLLYRPLVLRGERPSLETLAGWHEINEGMWTRVDLDLSALAGKNVQFILTVNNGDDSPQNSGFMAQPNHLPSLTKAD